MANLQLATNMANIRQFRNKIFNEMAKRPFQSGDFDENGDLTKIEKNPQSLACKSNEEAKSPRQKVANMARNRNSVFEGDGKFAENG